MTNAVERVERPSAACTLHRDGPAWDGRAAAAIGRFGCADAAAGVALLREIAGMLAAEGVAGVLGPMDGDTWHSYRAITWSDGSPPFLMEPTAGPEVAEVFRAAGFSPVSSYVSARARLDDAIAAAGGAGPEGVRIEAWDGSDPEGLVGRLFAMSSASFADYKPIGRDAFLELYRPLIGAIDPRLVLTARDGSGAPLGFLFAVPNHLEGARPRAVVLKTYASRVRGVGRLLADELHRRARGLGFVDVIHALMHEDNRSLASSAMFGAYVFRRYTLFGRRLAT
jgi:L-amino acid N-acyltransferase YncA